MAQKLLIRPINFLSILKFSHLYRYPRCLNVLTYFIRKNIFICISDWLFCNIWLYLWRFILFVYVPFFFMSPAISSAFGCPMMDASLCGSQLCLLLCHKISWQAGDRNVHIGTRLPTLGQGILIVLHVLSDLQLPWITCCPIWRGISM